MHKRIISLFLILTLNLNAQQPSEEKFFLRTNTWPEPKMLRLNTPVFKDSIAKQPEETRTAHHITLRTESGINVPALFFDRESNVALIAGQGLPGTKESMHTFAKLFDTYDVILFDYRWHKSYLSSLVKSLCKLSPTKHMLFDEEEEVRTVLDFLKHHKKYEKVVGLGECYSNFLFAKIQSDDVQKTGKGPFTHLILDSCWHSFKSVAQSICKDPYIPFSPQHGGAPWLIKKFTNNSLVKWLTIKMVFTFMSNVSIGEHLAHLGIPTLFIYGLNDLVVQKHHFEALWAATDNKNRAALLTPYYHSDNLRNRAAYRLICQQFIQATTIDEFLTNY